MGIRYGSIGVDPTRTVPPAPASGGGTTTEKVPGSPFALESAKPVIRPTNIVFVNGFYTIVP